MKLTRRAALTAASAALLSLAGLTGITPAHAAVTARTLAETKARLDASLTTPGTAFAVDPASKKVVVSVDGTVTGDRLAGVRSVVARYGDAATVRRIPGRLTRYINGGSAIYISQYVCSLGFNVRSGSTYYFLTAGHCGNLGSAWYSNSAHTARIGTTSGSSFPGNDYALVKYASGVTHEGTVNLYDGSSQDITRAADPTVGQSVRRSGRTTGVHSGTVQALNATVNYAEGRVTGLIQTNVCAEGGDSGGPLFSGTTALGLTSGGNGDCTSGGTTYFQPVSEALSRYGVSVY